MVIFKKNRNWNKEKRNIIELFVIIFVEKYFLNVYFNGKENSLDDLL